MMRDLTENEWRAVELMREIKEGDTGHGTLVIDIANRIEVLFTPQRREKPPTAQRAGN